MSWDGRSNNESSRSTISAWRKRFAAVSKMLTCRWCWSQPPSSPWSADHLDPLLKAIDTSDHVIGRRPKATAGQLAELDRQTVPAS